MAARCVVFSRAVDNATLLCVAPYQKNETRNNNICSFAHLEHTGEIASTGSEGLLRCADPSNVRVRITSSGDAVLGCTYGVALDGSSAPGTRDSGLPAPSPSHLVTVDAGLLAPPGAFAKWVPSSLDIMPNPSHGPPANLRSLGTRATALLAAPSVAVAGRFLLAGRSGLLDFDLVDVLPVVSAPLLTMRRRPPHSEPSSPGPASSATVANARTSPRGRPSTATSAVTPASRSRVSTHSGDDGHGADNSTASLSASRGSDAASTAADRGRPHLNESGPSESPQGHSGIIKPGLTEGDALLAAALLRARGGVRTARSRQATGSHPASTLQSPMAGRPTSRGRDDDDSVWRVRSLVDARPRPWRLARVIWMDAAAAAAVVSATGSPAVPLDSAAANAASGVPAVDDKNSTTDNSAAVSEWTGKGGGQLQRRRSFAQRNGAADTAAAATTNVCVAFWFEPGVRTGEVGVTPMLCAARVDSLVAVAPAGTYTIPFVPGQRIECRRLGGRWAAGEVVRADRWAVHVRVQRPPRELDRSAERPNEAPAFTRRGRGVRVAVSATSLGLASGVATPARRERRLSQPAASRGESAPPLLDAAAAAFHSERALSHQRNHQANDGLDDAGGDSTAATHAAAADNTSPVLLLPTSVGVAASVVAPATLEHGGSPPLPATSADSAEPDKPYNSNGAFVTPSANSSATVTPLEPPPSTLPARAPAPTEPGDGSHGEPAAAVAAAPPAAAAVVTPATGSTGHDPKGSDESRKHPTPRSLVRSGSFSDFVDATAAERRRSVSISRSHLAGATTVDDISVLPSGSTSGHHEPTAQTSPRVRESTVHDVEVIPSHLWLHTIARPGLYCNPADSANSTVGNSSSVPRSSAGGGFRVFFRWGGSKPAAQSAVAAAAAAAGKNAAAGVIAWHGGRPK